MIKTPTTKFNKLPAAVLGVATGLINGLLGSGGGTIAVFGMQRYLGIQTHKSHATAISVILPLSVISLAIYARNGLPDLQLLIFVSLGGVAGGFAGAKLLKKMKAGLLHKVFGLVMLLTGFRMIFK